MKALLLAATLLSFVRNDGQYAQNDSWWQDQKVPKTQIPCCSQSDGTFAEEAIEGENYYVDFVANINGHDFNIKHMLVPDTSIIKGPNKYGRAIVWYYHDGKALYIRCFIAGSGI